MHSQAKLGMLQIKEPEFWIGSKKSNTPVLSEGDIVPPIIPAGFSFPARVLAAEPAVYSAGHVLYFFWKRVF
ncbi:MAG: hypothetical protein JW904_05925 [Spirochaetales bacterium]|nr:hypothetical protein [Spirochaetales bacterium]